MRRSRPAVLTELPANRMMAGKAETETSRPDTPLEEKRRRGNGRG